MHICLITSARILEIKYGGEGKFTTSLGRWLLEKNVDVTLIGSGFINVKAIRLGQSSARNDEEQQPTKAKKIRILNPPYFIYAFSRMAMSIMWVIKILSLNRKLPISLIHAQDTGYSGLAAVVAGKILHVPVLITSHGIRHESLESIVTGKLKRLILKLEYNLDKFTVRNANRVIAVNPIIKDYYEQTVSKGIDFIPIPIKLKYFQFSEKNRNEIRDELGIDKKVIVVGFVGRFSPEKNLDTLISAVDQAVKSGTLLKLVLVGTGPLESGLKERVRDKGIEDFVTFTGVRNDVGRILSSFDIFVLPSYAEGLSTSLLEAMSCGCAIICSDIPANRILLAHGVDALMVDPHKPDEINRAIKVLCENDSIRSRLRHNAKLRTREYDEEIIFSKMLQYYEGMSIAEQNSVCR